MTCRNELFAVILLAAIALSQASHIDVSDLKKESHVLKATTATPIVVVSEATKKPEVVVHKSTIETLHPSSTGESLKVPLAVSLQAHDSTKASNHELHKLCDYLKPICNSTDKIVPKQLLKIQSQFKAIVAASDGKLSNCFLEHYGFDPSMKSINKHELITVCQSKDLPLGMKNSFRAFEVCAHPFWGVTVDMELDKILAARANCTKNHNHPMKNETSVPDLIHEDDEDEFSLISAVVNQVFEDNKGQFANSSDVKFIDISTSSSVLTTKKPVTSHSSAPTNATKEMSKTEAIMNDPNTVMVVVDDFSPKSTSPAPVAINKTVSHHKLDHPISKNSTVSTTMKPAILVTKEPVNKTTNIHTTEKKPLEKPTTTVAEKIIVKDSNITEPEPTKVLLVTTVPPKSTPSIVKTTLKPVSVLKPTITPPIKMTLAPAHKVEDISSINKTVKVVEPKPILAKLVTTTTTTPKPVIQTLEEVLLRQEKEKQELENRLREEREMVIKELQKRQDEIDAKNAIRALQLQREATTNHVAEARMHQLEHDRQMAMDPIGHTIKHQQYELNKQRILNGKK